MSREGGEWPERVWAVRRWSRDQWRTRFFQTPVNIAEHEEREAYVPASSVKKLEEALEEIQGDAYLWQIDEGPWADDAPALIEHLRRIARSALNESKP